MTTPELASLRARAVRVPLEYPVKTAIGIVDTAPLVLIDLHTRCGIVGRAYVFTYTPMALAAVREMVAGMAPLLAGQPLAPADITRSLDARFRLLGNTGLVRMAAAGIDMAAWDALARAHGVPLVTLLGGTRRPVPAYDSHSMDGEMLGCRRAEAAVDQGFRAVKIKIGYASVAEDLAVVRAIRRVIGDGTALMVDYNQSLSVPDAIERCRRLADEGLAWIEEPTRQEDYAGHARIRAASRVPIQLGENWFGPDEMLWAIQAQAMDLAMPDVMKIGGVTGWLQAGALAAAHGVPMSSHIFQEFSCHLLAVTPTAHWLERLDLAGPVLRQPLRFEHGAAVMLDASGVGIEWDEAAVASYLVS